MLIEINEIATYLKNCSAELWLTFERKYVAKTFYSDAMRHLLGHPAYWQMMDLKGLTISTFFICFFLMKQGKKLSKHLPCDCLTA